MKKEYKKNIWIGTLSVTIIILLIVLSHQKFRYRDAIETKDHFVNSLRICLADNNRLNNELNVYQDFFWNEECENRTLKGYIGLYYNVMNWLRDGYQCDISRIISEQPDNARKDDRWRSMIECYECPSGFTSNEGS